MTDQYEFTALRAALGSGVAIRPAVFEVFARTLPPGRRYGVFAGLGRLLEALSDFRLSGMQLQALRDRGVLDHATIEYLRGWEFTGDIYAYREGELFFPNSPVLRVQAPFGDACLLETLVLSVLNYDSAVCSAAARMVQAAGGRPLAEMGSRRANEHAALAAARAAYIAGFGATSNLAAGLRWDIPTMGTAMHAFTLAHDSELEAFRAQIRALGVGTTLLVDTYDIEQGIRNAVEIAHEFKTAGPGAIRIDSGILQDEVIRARALLDEMGATDTKITVTSDLDEYAIDELAGDPADSFGVGTRLIGGSGAPTAGFVYKLVAIAGPDGEMRPVAKRSASKATVGGAKTPYRMYDNARRAAGELYSLDGRVARGARPLQVQVVNHGVVWPQPSLVQTRDFHSSAVRELPPEMLGVQADEPAFVAQPDRSYQEALI
jgi:nicotinate phosphoribosyltransferase